MSVSLQFDLSSLNGGNGFRVDGVPRGGFGRSVSSAGDINGDGFDDVLISQSLESYIIFGRASGFDPVIPLSSLNGENGFALRDSSTENQVINEVSQLGDLNADGIDDVIIGGSSKTYVVFGRRESFGSHLALESLNGNNGFIIPGDSNAVSDAGDVNGDGISDLIIGNSDANRTGFSEGGESYVVFGRSNGFDPQFDLTSLDGTNGFVINNSNFGLDGEDVSSAGDLNGDGFGDIAVTAFNLGFFFTVIHIIFGQDTPFSSSVSLSSLDGTTSLDGTNGFITEVAPRSVSRELVSHAGDVNGDGLDDLIVGASNAYTEEGLITGPAAGRSFVLFGRTDGFSEFLNLSELDGSDGFIINGAASRDVFGRSVSGVGDFNGDGIDDIIIGASGAQNQSNVDSGAAYIIYGKRRFNRTINVSNLSRQEGLIINGINDNDRTGWSVASAGDVNGDGIADVIVDTSPSNFNGILEDRSSYVVFGQRPETPDGDRIEGTDDAEVLRGAIGNDTLRGRAGDDTLSGASGDDVLLGNGGNDFLVGGRGRDVLIGGNGSDSLQGGLEQDRFVFRRLSRKSDILLDFNPAEDFIVLNRAGFKLDLPKGGLSEARFTIGSEAQDRSDRIIYDTQTGVLLFDPDGNRSRGAIAIASLSPGIDLSASNIRLL